MAFAHDKPGNTAGTSLYAAIKLARLVQKAKDCLKSRIKKCITSTKPALTTHPTKLGTFARKTVRSTVCSQSTSGRYVGRRSTRLRGQRRNVDVSRYITAPPPPISKGLADLVISSLLGTLDLHVSRRDLPLRTVAAQDSLFLKHDFHTAWTSKSLDRIYDVLDSTTELLGRLQDCSSRDGLPRVDDDFRCGDFQCAKFMANLTHLLHCLKQIAMDAVIHHYLDLVAAHIRHWHNFWQNRKRIGEGWFAEWPNGQRPLNTTWPWNVKPSLLVLWGVCWMFYGPTGHHYDAQDNINATGNERGTAQGAQLSGDFRTRQRGLELQPTPQAPTPQDPFDVWANPAPNTYPNYSWLLPQQAGVQPRRANNRESHEVTGPLMTNFLLQAILGSPLPTYNANVTTNPDPYITSTSTESSDLFATSSTQWPYTQGINQGPPPAYAPNYAPWQPTHRTSEHITDTLIATPQGTGPQPPVRSYAPPRQANQNPAVIGGSLGSFGFGLGLRLPDMQDYPSPHSNVSDQTTSSCLSVLPGAMISPRIPLVTPPSISMVPSVAGSSNSRHSSRRSTEPPRNAQGILYCADPECARQPPVFLRKCEWTKHMDKHTRPYVCEEPECDNIRGFTYSGGLLRHQREVHRQHGGPKVSCVCPHKDCKRSTGVGFSRKENLNEHLRRCHQPQHKEPGSPQGNAEDLASRSRKRRRAADAGGGGEQRDDDDELQREVKRLRKEVAEKEERIKNLEKWMENLTRGQGGLK